MARRPRRALPRHNAPPAGPLGLPALGVLEEFTRASLARWRLAGKNLDRFSNMLKKVSDTGAAIARNVK